MEMMHSCLCCLRCPPDKDLTTPYIHHDETLIYLDMLKECFNIQMVLDGWGTGAICSPCAGRLRDASDFKLQVQLCQAELSARELAKSHVTEEEPVAGLPVEDEELTGYERVLYELLGPGVAAGDGASLNEESVLKAPPVKQEPATDETDLLEAPPVKQEPATDETELLQAPPVKQEPATDETELLEAPPVKQEPATDETELLHEERSVKSEMRDAAAGAGAGPTLLSPVCGSAQSAVCSLPDVSASARARRQLAAACAVRLERLRESRAPRAQQHTYCCDMCTGQFNTKSTLIRHIRTHYRCADCRKSFMMSSCLSRHEPICTGNKRKKRELSETSASTRDHGEVLYSCDECGKGFIIKSCLRKHIQRRHTVNHLLNSSLYQNPKCHTQMSRTRPRENETSHKLNLERHRKNHTKEKRFKCSYCDYKCHLKYHLQTHQRIHTGEKPFKCDHCDYKCGDKSSLRYHQGKHTVVKPFKCKYCDYKCCQKSRLQIHQRIHTGEKPFKCGYCDYKCTQKSNLQTHQIIHTGEKPFKCGYCDYKCRHKSQLQIHQKIHTGEKSLKCGYCDYKCNRKSHLQSHQRIHTGEKPFNCGHCDFKCSYKSSLRVHERRHRSEAV